MAQQTAVHAGIQWMQWGPEVFQRAQREDKLVLLDSGATWCHWCHVMDRVTYEDGDVVRLVNEKFIPVRIDRDRLPDVDAKYQREAALVSPQGSAGGWPLAVLITPEGWTLFKATFLPPHRDERFGADMGLVELLEALDKQWRKNRQTIRQAGQRVYRETSAALDQACRQPGELSDRLIEMVRQSLRASYDPRHGGFGSAPKFFAASALEMLTICAWMGHEQERQMLLHTLQRIAHGGVCDQVGGGFHRYSVDERWHVPHFEKMAYDNAAMLAVYANAYALSGQDLLLQTARQSFEWIARTLADGQGRGFYASQDADVGPDDDGDYFTWTQEEFRQALGADAELATAYYDVDPTGDVHGRPGRNVLHVLKTPEQLARLYDRDEKQVGHALSSARARLLEARGARPAPAVDKTLFADLNGMMIDAMLTCHERLAEARALPMALTALDCLLADLRTPQGVFAHYRQGDCLELPGRLEDQAWMARALAHAERLAPGRGYLEAAQQAADYILANLTAEDGGFLSIPAPAQWQPAQAPAMRGWEDAPIRSAASVASQALTDLAFLTGRQDYAGAAAKALASYAGGIDPRWGTFLAGYAIAADQHLHGPRAIVVAGPAGDATFEAMADIARRSYLPNGLTVALDPSSAPQARLLEQMGYAAAGRAVAYVCRGKTCLPPARTAKELSDRLKDLREGL